MKKAFSLVTFLFPFLLFGQHIHQLSQPVPYNTKLLHVGNHTIMVSPLDLQNTAQKWVTFDTALQVVTAKKLVTPNAENIISQTYLEGPNVILRVDQLFIDELLYVTAYTFDLEGNLLHNQLITEAALKTAQPFPYHIVQSPNKNYVGIMQTLLIQQDSLLVNTHIFNTALEEINKTEFTVPFDPKVSDNYMPLINNAAAIVLPVSDKFDSYKLSTDLNLYYLTLGATKPQNLHIEFSRKKLRNYQFQVTNDTLFISALYSDGKNKTEITGATATSYSLNDQRILQQQAFTYSASAQNELKKLFAKEGRKGNLLNYLSPLPTNAVSHSVQKFMVMLSAHEMKPVQMKNAPPSPPDIRGVRQSVRDVQALVGTTLLGSNKPMTFIDASTYAATVGNTNGGFPVAIYNPVNNMPRKGKAVNANSKPEQSRSLLHFSFDETVKHNNFLKIQQLSDPEYSFFIYKPEQNGYSAIYYPSTSLGKIFLQQTTIDGNGNVSYKKILENTDIIMLADYDFKIVNNSLVGFCEDKFTGQMGLIKIAL